MKNEIDLILEAKAFILDKIKSIPSIALILGSGLGEIGDELESPIKIPFGDIPNFPTSTVVGHDGSLIFGKLEGVPVLVLKGRVHYYEGYSISEVVRPVRILQQLGVKQLLLTNAAGGIGKALSAGSLMMISDHISLFCDNPLQGENIEQLGERFPDMSQVYSKELKVHLFNAAASLSIPLEAGVYSYSKGPSYETPAEIKMLKTLGADAVGMSTVPEAIAAVHAGMEVVGISCITNMAAGIESGKLNHRDVIATADSVKDDFKALIKQFIKELNG